MIKVVVVVARPFDKLRERFLIIDNMLRYNVLHGKLIWQ